MCTPRLCWGGGGYTLAGRGARGGGQCVEWTVSSSDRSGLPWSLFFDTSEAVYLYTVESITQYWRPTRNRRVLRKKTICLKWRTGLDVWMVCIHHKVISLQFVDNLYVIVFCIRFFVSHIYVKYKCTFKLHLSDTLSSKAVFRIHDILGWIRILLFSSLTFKMPAKKKFLTQFFLLITFWRYIYIIFQR